MSYDPAHPDAVLGTPADESGTPASPDAAPAWPELDPRARHGLAGEIVAALDPHTEADPAGVLATFLTLFGIYVGAGPHARVGGAEHPARLYAVQVGRTARARKGTTFADVAPIFEAADAEFITERVTSNLGSGEGLLALFDTDDDEEEDQPAPGDGRALVYAPEFAQVLKVAAREHSTLSPVLRDAWDRARLESVVRKRRTRVDGVHVGVLGHVTAEELRRQLYATELFNGFANRFLFVCTRRSKRLPSGGTLEDHTITELGRRVRDAAVKARRAGRMRRTDAAERRWEAIYYALDDDADGLFGAATARAEAQMLRLSVVYALLDGAATIDVDHVEAARALWRYCEDSAAWIFGVASGDRVADDLLDALHRAGGDGLTRDQVRDLFSRHVASDRLDVAVDRLVDAGVVAVDQKSTGGRPATVYRAVSAKSAERGAGEGLTALPALSAHDEGPQRWSDGTPVPDDPADDDDDSVVI